MCAEEVRPRWKTLLAFAIIYFVWGSTFFAIRVGVAEIPPLLMAALRFGIAGLVMVGWSLARREATPRGREWGSVFLVALLIFVVDYGLLFWAEKRVPSGVAAVVLATIPAFMAVAEILFLGTQRMSWRLGLALVIGVLGVAVLTGVGGARFGQAAIDAAWAGLLVVAAVGWVVASVLTKKLPLPKSKAMSSGAQMLAGGLMCVVVSAGLGEWKGFRWSEVSGAAWLALGYLIVFGSILGFTAYVWLIHHESPTKVGTYAYVNPVVAVVVGYWLGGEPLGARTVAGSVLVLVSVAAITTAKKTAVPRQVEE
jgi:drug/metabolite transporter (DMT)-like permease